MRDIFPLKRNNQEINHLENNFWLYDFFFHNSRSVKSFFFLYFFFQNSFVGKKNHIARNYFLPFSFLDYPFLHQRNWKFFF